MNTLLIFDQAAQWAGTQLTNLVRSLFFMIDGVIYNLIPTVYKLFVYLSEVNFFSYDENDPLGQLIQHVYVLLGIFMLFKVSFSLLRYLVDPNEFKDSSKGAGKLVTNILVAMILLVSVPTIFSYAMKIQSTVVNSNVIGQLILGDNAITGATGDELDEGDIDSNAETFETMARDLQFTVFGAFVRINANESGPFSSCGETSLVLGSVSVASNEECLTAIGDEIDNNDDASSAGVTLKSFFKYTDEGSTEATDNRNFAAYAQIINIQSDGIYVFDYQFIVSSIVGGYLVILLVSFSIDIAVRAIKLCFLQMVAPIAIISYVDPKESIGSGKLHNWISECGKTYFSLFLRIATVYFIILLVDIITTQVLGNGTAIEKVSDTSYHIWIYLFLIIGAFMFAKQVPNMIESIFGIKMSGEMSLNPFKNEGMIGLGATGAAVGGLALGGVGNAWSGILRNQDLRSKYEAGEITKEEYDKQRRGAFKFMGSVAGGALSSSVRSFRGALKGGNPLMNAMIGTQTSSDARRRREAGYGFVQNTKERFSQMAGIEKEMGTSDYIKGQIKEKRRQMLNAQRDEQAASYQMQQYMAKDPGAYSSFVKAFAEDSKGEQIIKDYNSFLARTDANGNNVGWIYENGDQTIQDLYADLEKRRANLTQEQYNSELDALVDNINLNGKKILDRNDFETYESMKKVRDSADEKAKSLEKEITRLEETKGFKPRIGEGTGGKK